MKAPEKEHAKIKPTKLFTHFLHVSGLKKDLDHGLVNYEDGRTE